MSTMSSQRPNFHPQEWMAPAGTVRSCGWKFGRWLDIVMMERGLGAGDTTPPAGE
jgi:phosphinothricin acetyltransferase